MWLTELLKNAIKMKNKLHLKSLKKSLDTAANEIQYKKYRNKFKITFWGVLKENTSRTS